MIRSLDVDNTRMIDELFDPVYTPPTASSTVSPTVFSCYCANLRSLTCEMMSLAESDVGDYDRWDCSEALVVLVSRNPRLLELHVKKMEFRDKEYNAMFFSALTSHPSLSSLQISSIGLIDRAIYKSIVQSIPNTLRSLSITVPYFSPDEDEEPSEKQSDQTLLLPQDPSKPIFGLQELHLTGYMVGSEVSVLFPLLRMCPQLDSFTVPEIDRSLVNDLGNILKESCPRLENLGVYWNDLWPSDLATLVTQSFPALDPSLLAPPISSSPSLASCRLRSLTIGGWIDRIEHPNPFDNEDSFDSIPAILNHCGSTLERLRIQEGLDVPWADYELILTSCPKLKELSYIEISRDKPLRPVYGYHTASLEELVSAPSEWVCRDIEILHMIVFESSYKRHAEPDQSSPSSSPIQVAAIVGEEEEKERGGDLVARAKEPAVPTMLSQLYQRLGQLHKLKELTLGWESVLPEKNFSMKLEAGLGHLSGLKDLEVVHVWFDPPTHSKDMDAVVETAESESRFIGQQERDWMELHWPKLKEYKETARDMPDEDEEF
ncbi:hypothetical protein BGX26_005698 [Mortierella sp. AD094]|nr:hypothetical protein BGX26_005698 [Mortierella sp. AD094]